MSNHTLPAYAELYCISNYSFLRGASHPEELVERAAQLGYSALALTDECSVSGVVKAHAEAKKHQLPLIVGASFVLNDTDPRSLAATNNPLSQSKQQVRLQLLMLAQNLQGYGNLCELITVARQRAPKGHYQLLTSDLDGSLASAHPHLVSMPGCQIILVPDYGTSINHLKQQAQWASRTFKGRCHIALTLLHHARDKQHKAIVLEAASHCQLPVVATGQVEMHVRSRKPLHDTLCAIRLKRPLAQCGRHLAPNAEQHLRSRLRLANIYPTDLLEATTHLASQCIFSLDELRYHYPSDLCPPHYTPTTWLRRQTYKGADWRFPNGIPASVHKQIKHELQLIAELKYEPYFLTVHDIVQFARQQHILCQGRGSAANSAVCYCLGITEVDPARGNSLFERFISKERNEPPDIDVDFEHQRREEVLQYIYRRYGHDRSALAAVVITYRSKSALRDTGKALGIDSDLIDRALQIWHPQLEQKQRDAYFRQWGLDPTSGLIRQWLELAKKLYGFPRHLSQHPGGFIISQTPLFRLVPIENAAMNHRSVVQWDKDDLDTLGILKIDILALGMLSVIRRALQAISQRYQKPFELHDIPAEDPATYDMLCQADAMGVFQIESRAQTSMLSRLQPRTFYDLVIQIAIVRPGPIQGGMVHPYLRRRKKLETICFPGKALEPALGRTLGIPIFQEQVMQIAMIAAGFTAGQADELRRAMAAWRRKGTLDRFYDKLVNGMLARGYEREFAEQIFRQIQGFGEYGFPESHSASFALLAYASAWLKRHEPAAFLAALLNSQPMGFYSPASLVQDARRHHVDVLPPSLEHSSWETQLDYSNTPDPAVRLGFNQIRKMSKESARRIEAARASGPFQSMADLARRATLDRNDLHTLASANVLSSLTGSRRIAHWEALASAPEKGLLAPVNVQDAETPQLPLPTEGQNLVADYRAMGLSLGRHPLALLREQLTRLRFSSAAQLRQQADRRISRACGLVTARQRPATAKGVIFVTLEDETGQVNLIVRSNLAMKQRRELLQTQLLGAYGTWQSVDNVQHLLVGRLVSLDHLLIDLPKIKSRDFH